MIRRIAWFVPVAVFFLGQTVWAQEPTMPPATQPATQPSSYMRFVDDGHGGGKLETAIATYRNDDGVAVHLVAAVHIADQPYYDGLNKTFKGYDALLYEMVKPKDAEPPQPGEERSNSMISVIQRFMKDTLDLKFQLDAIDYTAPNFVHADLDADVADVALHVCRQQLHLRQRVRDAGGQFGHLLLHRGRRRAAVRHQDRARR